jgi:hypothetical protein
MMNNSRFFAAAGTVLALCTLVLTGCPPEAPKAAPDPRLIGAWTNGQLGGLAKTFTIDGEYKFTASINPTHIGAYNQAYQTALAGGANAAAAKAAAEGALAGLPATDAATRWTVMGKLTSDGDNLYRMSDLREIGGKPGMGILSLGGANTEVKSMNAKQVKISFSGDNAFTFRPVSAGDELTIGLFFGGTYTRKAP